MPTDENLVIKILLVQFPNINYCNSIFNDYDICTDSK